jgi:hypothetical protein
MESIGAIHCGAWPEVRVRVTVPIGAAWAPRVDGENSRPKTVIRFFGAPYIEVLRGFILRIWFRRRKFYS